MNIDDIPTDLEESIPDEIKKELLELKIGFEKDAMQMLRHYANIKKMMVYTYLSGDVDGMRLAHYHIWRLAQSAKIDEENLKQRLEAKND